MEISSLSFTYTLSKKRNQKYLRIRISRTGDVMVSAPVSMPDSQIYKALASRETWVNKHLKDFDLSRQELDPLSTVMLQGRTYRVETGTAAGIRGEKAEFLHDRGICLVSAAGETPGHCLRILEKELRKQARDILGRRLDELSRRLGIPYNRLFLRDQHTRWGSSSGKGNISINWRVVMLPPELQEYLVIHELCHQRHFNHSPAYWKTVESFCPEYKLRNKQLNEKRAVMSLFR